VHRARRASGSWNRLCTVRDDQGLKNRMRDCPGIRGAVLLLGVLSLAGCGHEANHVLGAAPTGKVQTVANVKLARLAAPVTLRGDMTEKCPVAGCWFMVHDATGTIKVDTKAAGFVVLDIPVHSTVTVVGTVQEESGGHERLVAARGVRY
jgi:uncharacterized protein YdeI (BOF family)